MTIDEAVSEIKQVFMLHNEGFTTISHFGYHLDVIFKALKQRDELLDEFAVSFEDASYFKGQETTTKWRELRTK